MGEQQPNPEAQFPAQVQPQTPGAAWVRPPGMPGIAPISQLAIAYPFLGVMWFVIGMSASIDYEILGTILALFFGPIFGMGVAVVLGLPFRLNRRLSRWWLGNGRMYIFTAALGAALILSGYNKQERQVGTIDGVPYDVITPDAGLLMAGCFLITFLAVNASLPLRWTNRPSS